MKDLMQTTPEFLPKIAVLMTCFNRCQNTLKCLNSLFLQQGGFSFQVFLVDDGCSDGTAVLVQKQYPTVTVIKGTGQLYWNGGMRLAWQHALAAGHFDYFLWLNDDVQLSPDAVATLLKCFLKPVYRVNLDQQTHCSDAELEARLNQINLQQIAQSATFSDHAAVQPIGAVTASMVDPRNGKLSYGGRRSLSRWFPLTMGELLVPQETMQSCDFINGNCCLISHQGMEKVGILSDQFTHSMGDYDYGLRLKQAGFSLWISPGILGLCQANSWRGGVLDHEISLQRRKDMLKQPNRWPPAREWRYFVRQHGGIFWPLLCGKVLLREWFPRVWLIINARRKRGAGS